MSVTKVKKLFDKNGLSTVRINERDRRKEINDVSEY